MYFTPRHIDKKESLKKDKLCNEGEVGYMAMHLQNQIQQQQRLVLSFYMRQSIHILQLSSAELIAHLQEQAVDNPFLELSFTANPVETIERVSVTEQTLEEVLIEQLRWLSLPSSLHSAAQYICGNLDANGYLPLPLETLAQESGHNLLSLEKALAVVQTLEPAGVGARSLKECLLLQIDRDSTAEVHAQTIVEGYLPDLGAGRFDWIAKQLGISVEEIKRVLLYIRGLQPRPGQCYTVTPKASYVVPDAVVAHGPSGLEVSLSDRFYPKVHLVPLTTFSMPDLPGSTREYLEQKRKEAVALYQAIEQRKTTLYKVVQRIMHTQQGFIQSGERALQPLKLEDIAQDVGLHESTVSRTITDKYVQTPRGIYPIKYFMAKGLDTNNGGTISVPHIKEVLRSKLKEECVNSPFSDQELTELLQKDGISISRRTVAKYRKEIGFARACERKNR
jgi:RNA polymerase sigma-54 factor